MPMRVRQSVLAVGLVLGCVTAQATAQHGRAAEPPATLWSVLNLPTLDRITKAAKPKPKKSVTANAAKKKSSSGDEASKKATAAQPPEPSANDSATASPFPAINSSRRSAIQKRELAHDASAASTADLNPPSSPPQPTPHWTPKFAEQAACLQLADDEAARPIAVTMAGDPLSERITAARAVARMDATLNVAPSLAHGNRRQRSSTDTAAAEK